MLTRLLFICLLLLAVVSALAGMDESQVKGDDLYTICEHEGEGRWLSFDAPLEVRHCLESLALSAYKLKLTASINIRDGKQSKVLFTFTEEGIFKPASRPQLPLSTHVDLVIGERNSAAIPLTPGGFMYFGGKQEIAARYAPVPLHTFRQIVRARSLRGQLYWRSTDGEIVEQNDLRFFTLNEKAMRTLVALDAKSR